MTPIEQQLNDAIVRRELNERNRLHRRAYYRRRAYRLNLSRECGVTADAPDLFHVEHQPRPSQ